ncbi:alpha-mannosidase [Clostridium sp. E02]|uniref:alpha-mannosidase n=1 Tax=Clostridium sp. E02 TaxID=2487134 RepID=UPI000F51DD36|nr:alpha-mannosidase [Clostridium sp. E02]
MNPIRNRLNATIDSLDTLRYPDLRSVKSIFISPGDYKFRETVDYNEMEWNPFQVDETWGGTDQHYWFYAQVKIPEDWVGRQVRATLNTGATDIWNTDNPQIMVYMDGKMSGTMDMNHQDYILTMDAKGAESHDLLFYAYSNSPGKTNFFQLKIGAYSEEIASLYYDLLVPFEAADLLESDDLEQIETFKILTKAINLVDLSSPYSEEFFVSIKTASQYLKEDYYKNRREHPVTVHSIGHTHIDVAWKWPLKQTRQKTVRSFRTVLNLMKRYPEYKFMSSQPQLYEFVREEAPELFEEIKERIREGRWETEGAMWLEPDCNLASGESLVRHILYGRRYFEKELSGPVNEVLWLPDVFGYSAALPQIMKQSGISYFMTTKLGWNEYNQFPHDTFVWKGIDGSEVLTYLISTKDYHKNNEAVKNFSTTYNGRQDAKQIMGTWQRYQDKDVSKEVLTCYGHGDGGGGPTEEMLEQSRRLEQSVARCPKTKQTFVKDFFHILEERMDKKQLPVWFGELYLEYHRGTYTSMAKNKKYNRMCEFLNGDAEFYAVLDLLLTTDGEYPKKDLEENWKLLLLNQFHDILPGSSIKEVYEDSWVQYEAILNSGRDIIKKSQARILDALGFYPEDVKPESIVVFNSLSFERTGIVELDHPWNSPSLLSQKTWDDKMICLAEKIPSKGLKGFGEAKGNQEGSLVFKQLKNDETGTLVSFQTDYYEVELNQDGNIKRLYDRKEERNILKDQTVGNELLVFEDRPLEFDAWNIDVTYEEKVWQVNGKTEVKLLENGPVRGMFSIKRQFMDSEIEQKVCFYSHTQRIDFKTKIDWNQHQMLLKAAFPLDIVSREANFDIQFGNVNRPTHKNTSWDQAQYEVCAHKWADVSEPGYGAALLNDCKYGYDIHDSVIRLTLLKSGIFPNPDADQGEHIFTYSLFPHTGDFRTGGVVQEAYDLNCPLTVQAGKNTVVPAYSFLNIKEENILADTIKSAEDGDGIIVRFYEAYGKRTQAHIAAAVDSHATYAQCNCMEEETNPIDGGQGELQLTFQPYEIKTIKISI